MKCLFDKDFTGVDQECWDIIYTEYMDISGISETIEKDLLVQIHNLHVRILTVPAMIEFQCNYFSIYKEPYFIGFEFFQRHGHKLKWDIEQPQKFAQHLERIEIEERRFVSELNRARKELDKVQTKGARLPTGTNGRKEFIKLLNNVGKYRRNDIDREKVDVETYGLMVKDYFENSTRQNK